MEDGKIRRLKFSNKIMQGHSDEELIQEFRTANGSQRQKAFDCLYLRHAEPVAQYFFFALNRNYEKSKDFAHDLFLKLLEAPEKIDATRPFKPWLYKVASNMCKNEYRRAEVVNKFRDHVQKTDRHLSILNETEVILSESIKKLNQEQRSLIVLRFRINMSIKEIASIYECPEGTIKSRLFYAVKELTKHYKNP
jgi:RNA polymerase sigma-70 factor (ECF subfamily)